MAYESQRTFWSLYGRFVFDDENAAWKDAQVRRIVEILAERRIKPGERVLDAGCGTGIYSLSLAQAGFRVTGIDYASGMLARARAKLTDAPAAMVSFQQMDLNARLAFADSSFDHAISISALQVAACPAFTLAELGRVLKPRGTLLLLHVPKPQSLRLPLLDLIKHRVSRLGKKTFWKIGLVAAKAVAERTGAARYWTAEQLREMLIAGEYDILSVDDGTPIVIVAEKA